MSIPSSLKYAAEHEWLDLDGGIATVGITSFAADALGDIVYLDLPDVGTAVTAGESCGEIESTKSVSDLCAPVGGDVVEVNEAVIADPGLVNSDPFKAGWLFRMTVTGSAKLLDAAAYQVLTGGAVT